MQILTFYNASLLTQHIPGFTALPAGSARDVALEQVNFDTYMRDLLEKGPSLGLGTYTPDGSSPSGGFTTQLMLGLFTVLQERRTATGALGASARMQICVTTSGAYAIALPLATAVPAGDTIFVFNDARVGGNTLSVGPATASSDTIDGSATLTRSAVVFAARSGVPASTTVALVEDATTASGIHSIVEVAGVSTVINANFASGDVTAADVVAAITAGTGVTVSFAGSVNVSATTASPATVVAAAAAAALVAVPVALTAAANTLRFVSDGVSNWTTY